MIAHSFSLTSLRRATWRGCYRWLVGVVAALCWSVAVLAFAAHVTTLETDTPSSSVLAVLGWGLGLCACALVAKLLEPTGRPQDREL